MSGRCLMIKNPLKFFLLSSEVLFPRTNVSVGQLVGQVVDVGFLVNGLDVGMKVLGDADGL